LKMAKKGVPHTCIECGGKMGLVKDINFRGYQVSGLRCTKCKFEEMDLEMAGEVIKLEKMKVEGLTARAFKSGNSISIRIPMALARVLHIIPGGELQLKTRDHVLEIEA